MTGAIRPNRRFRWLSFRLRSLLIVMLVCALSTALVESRRRAVRRETTAVETMRMMQAQVGYDYEYQGINALPPGQAWIRYCLGDRFFATVSHVRLSQADWGRQSKSPSFVQSLRTHELIRKFPVKSVPKVLEQLAHVRSVSEIGLSATDIDDQGLHPLGRHRELERLHLDSTAVSDAGLRHLAPLNQLRVLTLGSTRVRGSGLRWLTCEATLRNLYLSYSAVNDEGLAEIGRFRQLQSLDLSTTRVTDDGLLHLARLHRLEYLDLEEAAVTDRSIDLLMRLPALRYLNLEDTQVTPDGAKRLQAARRSLKLDY